MGLGGIALANLMNPASVFAAATKGHKDLGILTGEYHFPPKAKRVIYLFMMSKWTEARRKLIAGTGLSLAISPLDFSAL